LTYKRFNQVNFGFVKLHIPQLADLTRTQLMEAVDRHKDSTPEDEYNCPQLKHVFPYLPKESPAERLYDFHRGADDQCQETPEDRISRMEQRQKARKKARHKRQSSTMHFLLEGEPLSAHEFRAVFVSMLRSAYHKQIKEGELMSNHFLTIALVQSLEFTEAAVAEGEPLRDWDFVTMMDRPISGLLLKLKNRAGALGCLKSTWAKRASMGWKATAERVRIDRSLSFIAAHKWAQDFFIKEFQGTDSDLSQAAKLVLEESRNQVAKAEAVLNTIDHREVELAVSNKFCTIILVSAIFYIGNLVEVGLLKESEAEHMVEKVQEQLDEIYSNNEAELPAEFSFTKHSHQEEEHLPDKPTPSDLSGNPQRE
jgi:hypothetical protein